MRHLRKGRRLGRSSSHRKALFRNMASSLILTERHDDVNESKYLYSEYLASDTPGTGHNAPKVKGRIVTTVQKAKELRPYVEKCITVAKKGLQAMRDAKEFGTDAKPNSDAYRKWRESPQWQQWNQTIAPALTARRRAMQLLGNQRAVEVLFDEIAPRFEDRDGGYTRILKLAQPRLGDAGKQAILEFVGNERDRVKHLSERPAFDIDETETESEPSSEAPPQDTASEGQPEGEPAEEQLAAEEQSASEAEASADQTAADEGSQADSDNSDDKK